MLLPPSKNVTVPVAADGETVAVNVTAWPDADGFRLDTRLVVVGVDPSYTQPLNTAPYASTRPWPNPMSNPEDA